MGIRTSGKTIAVTTILVVFILALAELLAWGILLLNDGAKTPFFETSDRQVAYQQDPCTHLDVHLGWSNSENHDPFMKIDATYLPGYTILGNPAAADALNIMVLGGSSSDLAFSNYNWPLTLWELLEEEGITTTVHVGAVSGYQTWQELFKLVRDIDIVNPHIIISLSGANEPMGNTDYPFVTRYQYEFFQTSVGLGRSRVLPNLVHLVQSFLNWSLPQNRVTGVHYGLKSSKSIGERWRANHTKAKAVSDSYGATYVAILQPVLSVGEYTPSPKESAFLKRDRTSRNYPSFYREARRIAEETSFIHDFSDVFRGETGLYSDDCHVFREGNEILGRAVLALLRKLGLLDTGHGTG